MRTEEQMPSVHKEGQAKPWHVPTAADVKAAADVTAGIWPGRDAGITVIGPRSIKEALVLRRLSEISGVPVQSLAKRLAEIRESHQAREMGWRRELSEYVESQAVQRLGKKLGTQFLMELTELYAYVAELELLTGMDAQSGVMRDREAECAAYQSLVLLDIRQAMRVRELVAAEDFRDEIDKQTWAETAAAVPLVAAGGKPELIAEALVRTRHCAPAVAMLKPATLYRFRWPEYLQELRDLRISRERAVAVERLKEGIGDASLFLSQLKTSLVRIEGIERIDAKQIRKESL